MSSRVSSRSFAWHQANLEELRPSIIQNRWILRWFSDHCAAKVLIQLGQVLVRFHAKGQYLRACWCWLCCCCCPLVWGLNVSLGRYGKAWQSPDITLLLMLDIFTSSQSGESNPSSTQRFFGDWCEQKRLKMGWNQRDNGEEPNRTLLCFFLQEGGAAKDTRVNFTLKN